MLNPGGLPGDIDLEGETMKAVVLAGGKGTRLAPHTRILPKPLMPIGDMPILEILIRQMQRFGVNEVIITIGHLAGLLQAFFQDGSEYGLKIRYSTEDVPLGTAGPLSLIDDLDETFLVVNGDVLTTLDMASLVGFHQAQGAAATIAMHQRKVKIDLGVIRCNGSHEIIDYTEKPTLSYQVSMGIYVFEPAVLAQIPHAAYLDFPDLILKLLKNGDRVIGYPFDGYWQDLGSPVDYDQAAADFPRLRNQLLYGV